MALGFLAADARDPRIAGREIIQALHERYEQGQRVVLGPQELGDILGGSNLDARWQAEFESLACNARVNMDCAEQLIGEVAETDSQYPRLSVLLGHNDIILRQTHFGESQERDAYTPFPPYRQFMDVGRLRLAISYRTDSTQEFLEKAAEDFEWWEAILREGEALATKMVSLAGTQNDLDFLSTLMRSRALSDEDLQYIRQSIRPFAREERDIGEAFVSEARIALLTDPHPMTFGSSWIIRLIFQENATLNEEYRTVFAPMIHRASLSAQEYYRQEAYKAPPYALRVFPPPLFNLGGKLARRSAWDGVQLYFARVHDENGRISLALLQAEIEQRPDTAIEDVIRHSTH